MLERLDDVPWADIEDAYGPAEDVPDHLRKLLDPDPEVRSEAFDQLDNTVIHQGTRFPAASYVVPFLIELCASPAVPERGKILEFWGTLIATWFSVQFRPAWGDGERFYWNGEVYERGCEPKNLDNIEALHRIYRESLQGLDLLMDLLVDDEPAVRARAAWVLACLPTMAGVSVPRLEARVKAESDDWVLAAVAFALGELGATAELWPMVASDSLMLARCMAACQLARIAPSPELTGPLIRLIDEPIAGYDTVPGAGGNSSEDASFSLHYLPIEEQAKAIPALRDRFDKHRRFETMTLVNALLSAAFSKRMEPLTALSELQTEILVQLVNAEKPWSYMNLKASFQACGLPPDRDSCAALVGVKLIKDEVLDKLRKGLGLAKFGILDEARDRILQALETDPTVFERAPAPDESWLLCARAFAETDPERAVAAFERAKSLNPAIGRRVDPTWRLADLLKELESR